MRTRFAASLCYRRTPLAPSFEFCSNRYRGADSKIVMAEHSSRDVVDQTLSGGEPSPSDVPASINDNHTAGGDAGETKHIATKSTTPTLTENHSKEVTKGTLDPQAERTGGDKDADSSMVSCCWLLKVGCIRS